ncbi:MAG: cysteine desulfurase [Gemmatimonadales bacterium]|nr:cysteine desulfurase [Gemmatimonadales bacterium]
MVSDIRRTLATRLDLSGPGPLPAGGNPGAKGAGCRGSEAVRAVRGPLGRGRSRSPAVGYARQATPGGAVRRPAVERYISPVTTTPIYLDHSATTPVRREVLEAMLPFLGEAGFGNPSSSHRFGRSARAGLEQARREVAQSLGAEPSQVIFTSGGTEADNLAVIGAALAARQQGRPMVAAVSAVEHKAVLAAAHQVKHLGGEEIILPVTSDGQLDLAALDAALARSPAVVSVMWVNNETGVRQPLEEISARCSRAGALLHSDAVQAFGKVPVSFRQLPCTLLTISGHKIGAPKGIGALIVRDRKAVEAIIHGGGQQFGIRPGTENVAGAVALGRAAVLAAQEQGAEAVRLGALRDGLIDRLRERVADLTVHGEGAPRAPHILNAGIPGAESEALLMHLDLAGIACSGGSACSTGAAEPSHVLSAMGVPRALALGSIRMSLGHETTPEEIDRVVQLFPGVVEKVRHLSVTLGRA